MLAPMIRETPAAIEKNAVAEGMSRMMVREVKGTLQYEPDPAKIVKRHYRSNQICFLNGTISSFHAKQ